MTDSVCEVEYIVASDVVKEAVWLRKFIGELEVASSIDGLVLLYYNSTRAIAQVKESKSHQCTKYIRTTTILSRRLWIKVMLTFRRSMERYCPDMEPKRRVNWIFLKFM